MVTQLHLDIAIKSMGKIDHFARVVTIVGGKLAAVGGCDDVFGRAESVPWGSAQHCDAKCFSCHCGVLESGCT